MTEKPGDEIDDVSTAEMDEFCTAVGALILWASMIDRQLNKALVNILALPEHAMIEPIVAQLDARPKAELLKKRAKFITNVTWRNGIKNWVERAEKVNANRNFVAHHSIRIRDGKIAFHSVQLGKMLDSLKRTDEKIEVSGDKGIREIGDWIEEAKKVVGEGSNVLANLERLRIEAAAKASKKS
jgi:hypothetical protein